MKFTVFILIASLSLSCVKDESVVPLASIAGTTGGSTTGGSESPVVGTDPLAVYAWHLKNTGQTSFSSGAGISGHDIMLEEAHALGYRGKNIRIAVSDTGVEYTHTDLFDNHLEGEHRNYLIEDSSKWINGDPTPGPGATDAHGTAVTGLVAALGWNGIGSRGVAPESLFAGFKFIIPYPVTMTDSSYEARVLDQLTGNFDIFNYSYGSGGCSFEAEVPLEHEALKNGAETLRNGKGALYVQSSGNGFEFSTLGECSDGFDNTNRDPSHASPFKILVGAVNAIGKKSTYSTPGSGLWVSAPGGEYGTTSPAMVTTDISGCRFGFSFRVTPSSTFDGGFNPLNFSCDHTSTMNGTSSAAPILSGVIALMLEANPELTWRDVKHILAYTSDKIDDSGSNFLEHPTGLDLPFPAYVYDNKWTTNGASYSYSNWYGFGRVNALEAVEMARDYSGNLGVFEETQNPNNDDWYYDSGTVSLSIPDNSSSGISSSQSVRHNFKIEAVQIRFTTDHSFPGDLAIHLVSPSLTESRLINLNSNLDNTSLEEDFLMISNAFYGEDSYGTWTLKVYDGKGSNIGTVTNWKLNILGARHTVPGLSPAMPGVPTMPETFGTAVSSPVISFDPSATLGVIRYEVSIGTTAGASDMYEWASIGSATSFQLHTLSLTNHVTYFINIRAVDVFENTSSVRSKSWVVNF